MQSLPGRSEWELHSYVRCHLAAHGRIADIARGRATVTKPRISVVACFITLTYAVPTHIRIPRQLIIRKTHAEGTSQTDTALEVRTTGTAYTTRAHAALALRRIGARCSKCAKACTRALILFVQIRIVARFAPLDDAIAARERTKEAIALRTAQARSTLPLIRAGLTDAIGAQACRTLSGRIACGPDGFGAVRCARIAGIKISIIARLSGLHDAVPADRQSRAAATVDAESVEALQAR